MSGGFGFSIGSVYIVIDEVLTFLGFNLLSKHVLRGLMGMSATSM